MVHDIRLDHWLIMMIGRRRAISTSKIKNTTAIKKNRKEKGSRAELFGSNPHSNGEVFSRSLIVFFDKLVARVIIIIHNINVIRAEIVSK